MYSDFNCGFVSGLFRVYGRTTADTVEGLFEVAGLAQAQQLCKSLNAGADPLEAVAIHGLITLLQPGRMWLRNQPEYPLWP